MTNVSRLYKSFQPESYELALNLEREQRSFKGKVTITGMVSSKTNTIVLHAKDLAVTKATINQEQASWEEGENDEMTFSAASSLSGEQEVTIEFSGKITDPMHGLYPCYYNVDGDKKEVLATQFESHHAREVFPCIDEPEAKATFDLRLTTETDVSVLGNMPVAKQEKKGNSLVTDFETSPRMSTYLLAFVVGDLQKISGQAKNGTEVNIWATKAQPAESLSFALHTATRAIDFFDDYFGVKYPLPKSDHVALPDFGAGAMENWGLITYREVCLLVDPKVTSVSSREYVARVIAHELSHQWFGNLVTMKWWDDLWLNESFASLMEYISLEALYPEWNTWLDFTSGESLPALRRDSLPGVQAVKTDVNHPDEISTLFDPAIVYAKGAKVLRMLLAYIGHKAFQEGLKLYFQNHAYKNTAGSDLWDAFSQSSGKNVGEFMKPWLEIAGFPVVRAAANGDTVSLMQEQFIIGENVDKNKLWPIPLGANQQDIPELMEKQSLEAPLASEYLKLNQNDTAHFIAAYDDELLSRLRRAVASKLLPAVDRLSLLHDASLLPRAGVSASRSLIPLLNEYADEDVEQVWDIIGLVAADLRRFVETDEESEKHLRALSRNLAAKQYKRLGWDKKEHESESDTKLRATIIAMMLYGEDADTIAEGIKRFDAAATLADLDSELSALIISNVVRYHSKKEAIIEKLIQEYQDTASGDIQQNICSGLTATKDPIVAQKLLDLMKNTRVVRTQDTSRWFAYLIRNRHSRSLTWQWIRDNWQWIEENFKSDKSYDNFPRYAAMALTTREQLEEFTAFFAPFKQQPALARAIEVGINEIKGRVEWIERDQAGVVEELAKL